MEILNQICVFLASLVVRGCYSDLVPLQNNADKVNIATGCFYDTNTNIFFDYSDATNKEDRSPGRSWRYCTTDYCNNQMMETGVDNYISETDIKTECQPKTSSLSK